MFLGIYGMCIPTESVWVTSDFHFDHTNIIKYCNRPFNSISEMNCTLMTELWEKVKPWQYLLFLGDMSFGRGSRKPKWWLQQMPGRVIYVKGSHDNGIRSTMVYPHNTLLVVEGSLKAELYQHSHAELIKFSHEPSYGNVWNVHGHTHENRPYYMPRNNRIHIGVDGNKFSPVPLDNIIGTIQLSQGGENASS